MTDNSWLDKPVGCVAWKQAAVKAAVEGGMLSEERPTAMVWSPREINAAFQRVRAAFPADALHTVAVKANQLDSVLKLVLDAGFGFECASRGELLQALHVCVDRSRLVFDSPCKSRSDIALALREGVRLNVDNMQELAVLASVVEAAAATATATPLPNLGIRVNPETNEGALAMTNVSISTSKFGVPLQQYEAELLQAYEKHPWLNMVHVHVGSQGISNEVAVKGIRCAVELALKINTARPGQITVMDIGGGLAVDFASETNTSIEEWSTLLRAAVPSLFDGTFRMITEFGRWYFAKQGFILSRVEYTKLSKDRHIALQHVGADLLVRTIYNPDKWPLRVSVFTAEGEWKDPTSDKHKQLRYDVAGPCCFASDIIAHERLLPEIVPGDYVLVHDVGGYYLSSFSFYNSRCPPPCYFYDEESGALTLVKEVTLEQALSLFRA
eukprot:m.77310 g.77310  ORF g.77310 m.77310 type:complete len:441 (+) comp14690_c0_seq1:65-1387(+)